jgi:hypothetical protein
MTPHEQIKEKILSLQNALLESNPRMPVLLQEIHRTLKNDPAIVTLLQEDEIAVIVSGLKVQTSTVIATTAVKGSVAGRKSLSKVSVDDLF